MDEEERKIYDRRVNYYTAISYHLIVVYYFIMNDVYKFYYGYYPKYSWEIVVCMLASYYYKLIS